MENQSIIKLSIYEMMAKRGIQTRKDLSERTGLAAYRVGAYVRGDVKRIDLNVLARFCKVLDCQPGDLLEHVEGK